MNKKLLIIDGSSLFFRAFYALPLLKTKKGVYTNAIYGFVMMLENAIEKIDPDSVVVCFDMKGKTFRNEIYDEYKGTRQKTPSELEQQFPIVRDILKKMNIKVLESPVYEADDIAGSLSKRASEDGYETYLLTGDKDYYQLVDENTKVLLTRKGIKEMDIISVESIREDFDIEPLQFIDLKGLMGDNSDNIPGVPGVGEKTGLKLVHQFGSMENLYNNLDEVSGKKLKEKLEDNKAQAFMSKKLGTIVVNVPIEEKLSDFEKQEYDYETLSQMYREYEFTSLLDRLPSEFHKEEIQMISDENFVWDNLEIEEIIKQVKENKSFAFKIITDGKVYEGVQPIYFAIKSKDENPNFIKLNSKEDILKFKDIFEDEAIEILGHNLKEDLIILLDLKINFKNIAHDSMIAEYLLNSTQSDYDINLSLIHI